MAVLEAWWFQLIGKKLIVSDPAQDLKGIYRYTSMARPIDPGHPSNRALLIVLPVLALISAALSVFVPLHSDALWIALGSVLTGFVAWALTRELAPNDDQAAFIAVALAWLAYIVFDASSLLLPVTALFVSRLVNRSTGLPARTLDVIAILGLSVWATASLEQPFVLLVTAAGFSLNAMLRDPQRLHFFAALACVVGFAWFVAYYSLLATDPLSAYNGVIIAALAAALLVKIIQNRNVSMAADFGTRHLDTARVNAGLVLTFFFGIQALLADGSAAWLASPLWLCVAAVLMSPILRFLWRQIR